MTATFSYNWKTEALAPRGDPNDGEPVLTDEDLERTIVTSSATVVHGSDRGDEISSQNDTGASLYGEGGHDVLVGGEGNDLLDGGVGMDELDGGRGDDIYVVDHIWDLAAESRNPDYGGGIDLILSAVDLPVMDMNYGTIENVTLIGSARLALGSTLGNLMTGNALDNELDGQRGDDTLRGLAGSDLLIGGEGDDTLEGGEGDDVLLQGEVNRGGAGDDIIDGAFRMATLEGGSGDDVYILRSDAETVPVPGEVWDFIEFREAAGGGTDEIRSEVDVASLHGQIENVTLLGSAHLRATGNAQSNTLTGNAGDNRLDGGAGADRMTGGAGQDTFVIDAAGDVVVDAGSGDLLEASIGLALTGQLGSAERLTLTGWSNLWATGNSLANTLTGNGGNNVLRGADGGDHLLGGRGDDRLDGGRGADRLEGGEGDDIYIVDDRGDRVIENVRVWDGNDLVRSSISFTLGSQLENLTLTGSADVDGLGNDVRNVLKGNGAANRLDGRGGRDVLYGGAGDDTLRGGRTAAIPDPHETPEGLDADSLYGGSGRDSLFGDGGRDQLEGGEGEDVLSGGMGEDRLLGGDGNDRLDGGAASDRLDGGRGGDRMAGGAGRDIYTVDSRSDVIVEAAGQGNDLVVSTASHSLSREVEQLRLEGRAAIDGTGNALSNAITGNNGANRLSGLDGNDRLEGRGGQDHLLGGAGSDTLNGGAGDDRLDGGEGSDILIGDSGRDVFVFTGGRDEIRNFVIGTDRLEIEADLFGGDAPSLREFGQHVHDDQWAHKAWIDLGGGNHLTVEGIEGVREFYDQIDWV